jgi:signal transduction histidine kinase
MIFRKKKKKPINSSITDMDRNELIALIDRKSEAEAAMLEIARLFRSPDRFETAVNYSLEQLVKFSGAQRAFVMQFRNPETMYVSHEATRPWCISIKRFMQNIAYVQNDYLRDQGIAHGYAAIADIDKLPPEGGYTREYFKSKRINALLVGSFATNYVFKGNISITNDKALKNWDSDTIAMLNLVCTLMEQSLERSEAERKLIVEKQRVEQSDKLKASFIANLSHEIRTPLNSIVGFSHLISSNQLSQEKKHKISKVLSDNTAQLLSVMDDLMDAAQIESETIQLEPSSFTVASFCNWIESSFRELVVNQGNLQFSIKSQESIKEKFLYIDRNRLCQILSYLIKNAVKFTSAGSISIDIKEHKSGLQISVTDTGIGISEENYDKIFERFWQLDATHTRNYGGNGLGLSIAKNLAELMEGTIELVSKLGKGSTFSLRLPKKILSNSRHINSSPSANKLVLNKKVLVADDFPSIHEYILNILEPYGYACTFAHDGMEAIRLLKEIKFDLVLLDIQMPYLDGIEVLETMRQMEITAPVIAETAHSRIEDEQKFIDLGFKGLLVKPFNPQQLIDKINQCIEL